MVPRQNWMEWRLQDLLCMDPESLERLMSLCVELKIIAFWDAKYGFHPDSTETIAFRQRRKRRREIIREIEKLVLGKTSNQ